MLLSWSLSHLNKMFMLLCVFYAKKDQATRHASTKSLCSASPSPGRRFRGLGFGRSAHSLLAAWKLRTFAQGLASQTIGLAQDKKRIGIAPQGRSICYTAGPERSTLWQASLPCEQDCSHAPRKKSFQTNYCTMND